MTLQQALLDVLACPKCRGKLEYHKRPEEALICRIDRIVFKVEDGIPIMLIDEAELLDESRFPNRSE